MKNFRAPNGALWGVDVQCPGSSNAMVVFHHADGQSARLDRYNWYLSHSPDALNVTSRLDPVRVLAALTDLEIAKLFRRSMLVDTRTGGVSLVSPR